MRRPGSIRCTLRGRGDRTGWRCRSRSVLAMAMLDRRSKRLLLAGREVRQARELLPYGSPDERRQSFSTVLTDRPKELSCPRVKLRPDDLGHFQRLTAFMK